MVIISIENKAHITMPKKMEYTKHLWNFLKHLFFFSLH
jgi:hypothetical protein